MKEHIPQPVLDVLDVLRKASFEAFIVGGCVRDLLLEKDPKDWDITTSALPEHIQALFPDHFYENSFGTVGVKTVPFLTEGNPTREHDIIEVTTYRIESDYTDNRRPSTLAFTTSLTEDLARRDFTINAIALSIDTEGTAIIIDPFDGQKDLVAKIIRTVGNPDERFSEDALRMMRAVRFYAKLRSPKAQITLPGDPRFIGVYTQELDNWIIEQETFAAIQKNALLLSHISFERIADEFSKIILSESPAEGVDMLQKAKLLKYILPEIEEGLRCGQNLHHIYHVYQHNILALKYCPSKKLTTRLAALLHDVAKPRTKRGDGYRSTFYNHDHVGARMTDTMLRRLRYSKAIVDKVVLLVDNHLFYYNVGEVSESSVRRLIRRVGLANMTDLMDIRIADRLGSGTPKAKPYKLRHLEFVIDKVSKDAISVKMLTINGRNLMQTLKLVPSPKIGAILDVLLAEVIENATKNTPEKLLSRAVELDKENLNKLRSLAKEIIEDKKSADTLAIKKKHWVQ
jgi:poly(A) polymerase/tRNA nucleotidyltransferase (CCA-adding enzyme)